MACKKNFLDLQPFSYSEDKVFSDIALSEAFINSLYQSLPTDIFNYPLNLVASSDEAKTTYATAAANVITKGNYGPESPVFVLDNWGKCYSAIRKANLFLANYHKLPDGSEKNRLAGEAYFLRAYFYAHLLKQYAGKGLGVPLIMKVQSLDNLFEVRAPYDICVDSVVNDLDKAALLLPLPNKVVSGRVSRGAAMALKSRVLLYAASPMNNPENLPEKWERAADAAKELIDLNYYGLHDDYGDVFLKVTEESIFYKLFSKGTSEYNLLDYNVQPPSAGGRGSAAPSQEAVDAYEVVTGTGDDRLAVPFDWTNSQHAGAPYQNRDPRFYASILYNGAEWTDGKGGTHLMDLKNGGLDRTLNPANATSTGYYLKKFMNINFFPEYRITGFVNTYTPWMLIRYAEVLLNYAEACLQTGKEEEARKYINMVRARKSVNMPLIKQGELTWERYMNERRVELAFEEHRFWDAKRWNIASGAFKSIHGISISDQTGTIIYTPVLIENRVYLPQMDIFPIPQSDIDKYRTAIPDFRQNPGWE